MRVEIPESLVEHARAFTDGTAEPAEPRNAATVVLMRDPSTGSGTPSTGSGTASTGSGPEVYLLRRQTTMAFAGGMAVFPGGGVDKRDFDGVGTAWAGPQPAEWATRLGCDEATARALVCAAVRETFEESGVLLAGESAESVVAETTGEGWEADRVALETRELSMTDFLDRRGLVLRTDLLGVWSAWLTPTFEPKRYRTWFFAARLPEGQRTRDVSSESSSVVWLPVLEACRQREAEELMMLPPTYFTCLEVGQFEDADAVLAATRGRSVEMFMPEVVREDDAWSLSMPPRMRPLMEERARATGTA